MHNHSNSKDQIKLVVYSPHSGNNTVCTASTDKADQPKETEMNGENVKWFLGLGDMDTLSS